MEVLVICLYLHSSLICLVTLDSYNFLDSRPYVEFLDVFPEFVGPKSSEVNDVIHEEEQQLRGTLLDHAYSLHFIQKVARRRLKTQEFLLLVLQDILQVSALIYDRV